MASSLRQRHRSPFAPRDYTAEYKARQKKKREARRVELSPPLDNDAERVAERTGKRISLPKAKPVRRKVKKVTPKGTTTAKASTRNTAQPRSNRPAGTTGAATAAPTGGRATGTKTKSTKNKGVARRTRTQPVAAAGGTPEVDEIGTMFTAARRELDRQQQIADAQRLAKMEDQRAFDEWVAKQRGGTSQLLSQEFTRTANDAAAARQQSLDAISKYANNARSQAAGADMLTAAGTDANLESYGFISDATAKDSAGGAFGQAALTQRNAAMDEADRARAANLMAGYNADHRSAMEDINKQRGQLSLDEIKARMENKQAERQFMLDQQAADFLNGLKAGELEVKQYEAQTGRMKIKLDAQAKRDANKVAAQIAAGKMDMAAANLALKKKGYALDVRKQIMAEAQAKAKGVGGPKLDKATDFVQGLLSDELTRRGVTTIDGIADGYDRIKVGYSMISALAGRHPDLTWQQATKILRGALPGHVMVDARTKREILKNFR